MPVCTKCERKKPRRDFSPAKTTRSGLQSWCKRCKREAGRDANRERMRGYVSPRRAANQEFVNEIKTARGCACGERDPIALDLHHRDPAIKEGRINRFIGGERGPLIREIAKCDVVCANCHRKLHRDELARGVVRGYRRSPQPRNV